MKTLQRRLVGILIFASGSAITIPVAGGSIPAPTPSAAQTVAASRPLKESVFSGRYYQGKGDTEYLQLLDIARRLFEPDPEFQNLPMLYWPSYKDAIVNGFVEGPTWDAWWIQNSFGPTYCALPFLQEPCVTFLQNSQDLWFDNMGDGKRSGAEAPFNWVAPDGCLCDAARPGWIVYRQGDGRVQMHDWAMEFTAAGILMQSELLLISRDLKAADHYLPRLERSANFIETRRNPTNNLFLAGPAGNLLAPSYAGWLRPDGTYDKAYLAGLSINYIAALDRLVELEKLAGHPDKTALYAKRRAQAREGLRLLTTEEGYFIRSLDPDGIRHGVFGAAKHGYFETAPNHDAICFRVVDDAQARKIYTKLSSIPELRPHDVCIPNYPGYDDMYEKPEGLWKYGYWVNGGHWSTFEARLLMAYYRLGQYEDARRSMKHIMKFVRTFRMDNNLTEFGDQCYQPNQPINIVYDTFGIPAGMVRGLFEYLYTAEGVTIIPHIPPGITELKQDFPIRFGAKRLYLATFGKGPITKVVVNGRTWKAHDAVSMILPHDKTPGEAVIQISLGGGHIGSFRPHKPEASLLPPKEGHFDQPKPANMTVNDIPLRIGADSLGGNRFHGDIARARVLSRTLSAEAIAQQAAAPLAQTPQEKSVVGDWRFDRLANGAFSNLVDTDLPVRAIGQVEVVDCPGGKAVRLSGNGYLEVNPHKKLDLEDACTLEAWICPESLPPSGARIIDKTHVGASDGYLLDTSPGNSVRLIAQCGTIGYDAKLVPGQWAHVVATVAADGKECLYVNGKLVASAPAQRMGFSFTSLQDRVAKVREFHTRLVKAGLGGTYEAAHARLAANYFVIAQTRIEMLQRGELSPLASARSQAAADELYLQTTAKLCEGLEKVLASYKTSTDPLKLHIFKIMVTQSCRESTRLHRNHKPHTTDDSRLQ